MCHVQKHWLSLLPALQCVVAIKSALDKLMIKELLKNDQSIVINDPSTLQSSRLWIQEKLKIEFLISIKPIFHEFMTKFQMEEPVIHLLHPSCVKLQKEDLGRLLKSNTYINKKGKALKEMYPQKGELQHKNDQCKTMQNKRNTTIYLMHLLTSNISSCLNSVNSFNFFFCLYFRAKCIKAARWFA